MSKLTSTTDLYTDIGGRMFKGQAPAGAEYPYVVFLIVSDVPDNVFNRLGETVLIQFSLFSKSLSANEIEDMYSHLKTIFDECAMTVTGATMLWMRRVNASLMVEDHTVADGTQQVWHYVVDYEITIQYS